MSKSNHTPGVWTMQPDPHGTTDDWMIGVEGGKPDAVAVCGSRDAPLLRSAAELLTALESALKTAEFERQPYRAWHGEARAAIAKAKA